MQPYIFSINMETINKHFSCQNGSGSWNENHFLFIQCFSPFSSISTKIYMCGIYCKVGFVI